MVLVVRNQIARTWHWHARHARHCVDMRGIDLRGLHACTPPCLDTRMGARVHVRVSCTSWIFRRLRIFELWWCDVFLDGSSYSRSGWWDFPTTTYFQALAIWIWRHYGIFKLWCWMVKQLWIFELRIVGFLRQWRIFDFWQTGCFDSYAWPSCGRLVDSSKCVNHYLLYSTDFCIITKQMPCCNACELFSILFRTIGDSISLYKCANMCPNIIS